MPAASTPSAFRSATRPNCGKPLRAPGYQAKSETIRRRTGEVRKGNNPWGLGNHAAKFLNPKDKGTEKVQRLDGGGSEGLVNPVDGLRYSPASWETMGNNRAFSN